MQKLNMEADGKAKLEGQVDALVVAVDKQQVEVVGKADLEGSLQLPPFSNVRSSFPRYEKRPSP
jgi:hypothetical protein